MFAVFAPYTAKESIRALLSGYTTTRLHSELDALRCNTEACLIEAHETHGEAQAEVYARHDARLRRIEAVEADLLDSPIELRREILLNFLASEGDILA